MHFLTRSLFLLDSFDKVCEEVCFSFCFKWVEDQAVANRLKEIWPNIVKVINYSELLP